MKLFPTKYSRKKKIWEKKKCNSLSTFCFFWEVFSCIFFLTTKHSAIHGFFFFFFNSNYGFVNFGELLKFLTSKLDTSSFVPTVCILYSNPKKEAEQLNHFQDKVTGSSQSHWICPHCLDVIRCCLIYLFDSSC